MKKVITYGSFDLIHYGHIRLLERAKKLGDYLIVGITSDDYDKVRGKINLQQSLSERVEGVRSTGLADLIIVEEYDGQKIDDIKRYGVDIFAIGSDWKGKFDYLNEYCEVIYLERTQGISSSQIRSEECKLRMGIIGGVDKNFLKKILGECEVVNGIEVSGIYNKTRGSNTNNVKEYDNYDNLLADSDAVFVLSNPEKHYRHIKTALSAGKHVLVEMPIVTNFKQHEELIELAEQNQLVFMPALKTAYATAYNRLILLINSGKIGKVISVDATCTSIRGVETDNDDTWNGICAWGPTALLPIFQLLGTEYKKFNIYSNFIDSKKKYDAFTKIDFLYDSAVASIKVGAAVKSEGELVVSGTKGYAYVPAPWWKTDYFELRYENMENNKKYFYQLDGEGIRYELVEFVKSIKFARDADYISEKDSKHITKVIESFFDMSVTELV